MARCCRAQGYLNALASHLEDEAGREHRRETLTHLAALLNATRINHRVPRKQARLTELKARAVGELRAGVAGHEFLDLGGPDGPEEWLRWALGLAGEEIEVLQQRLIEQRIPALAEWIESCEVGELEFSPMRPVSAEEQPEESDQAVPVSEPTIEHEQATAIQQAVAAERTPEPEAPPPQAPRRGPRRSSLGNACYRSPNRPTHPAPLATAEMAPRPTPSAYRSGTHDNHAARCAGRSCFP